MGINRERRKELLRQTKEINKKLSQQHEDLEQQLNWFKEQEPKNYRNKEALIKL